MGESTEMKRAYLLSTIIPLLLFDGSGQSVAQSKPPAERNLDSLARLHFLEISKHTPRALETRRRIRRDMQRKCYTNVLSAAYAQDGLSALLSFLKGKLLIEFSISHRQIVPLVPRRENGEKLWDIPEIDDWTFPANPWEKKNE